MAQAGEEQLGGGDQGDVVVPAGPGAVLEVVQAQTGLQLPVSPELLNKAF